MRFSDEFDVKRVEGRDDWFDPILDQDTPLYVDPFLVFDDKDPFWKGSRKEVIKFFGTAADLIEESGGNKTSPAYKKAVRLLTFPEPNEFVLGLSMGSPRGSGTGEDFANRMAEALNFMREHGHVADMATIAGFTLFCPGLGLDRISDILCNILKGRFIEYTDEIVQRHGIETSSVKVRHPSWNRKRKSWVERDVLDLPESPVTGGGLILAPERFLKDIPRVTAEGFWTWAEGHAARELREDLNYDMTKALTRRQKRQRAYQVARSRPDLAVAYVKGIGKMPLLPYDVEVDPRGLVFWRERGQAAAAAFGSMSTKDVPDSAAEFPQFIEMLAGRFKDAVENTDLWKALWNEGRTAQREEKIAQAIAGAMWTETCRAVDVDISQEVNRGRGPVDFKFSKGWTSRGLVEIKYIKSSGFFTGAGKQLPQYLATEQIDFGVYLCIGFTDADFAPSRLKKVEDTVRALAVAKGITIKAVYVDARKSTKQSASKQK